MSSRGCGCEWDELFLPPGLSICKRNVLPPRLRRRCRRPSALPANIHTRRSTASICLRALLEQQDGLIQPLLQKLGVPIGRLTTELNEALGRRVKVQGAAEPFHGAALKKPSIPPNPKPPSSRTNMSAPSIFSSDFWRRAVRRSRSSSRTRASNLATCSRRSWNCAATSA